METVLPGEVCSVETAKRLGIFDARAYLVQGYADTRVWRTGDKADAAKPRRLCTQDARATTGTAACVALGAGWAPLTNAPGKCIAAACPADGFVAPKTATATTCVKKPTAAADRQADRCDAQADDWFMLRNHHLGNAFVKGGDADKRCLAPCPLSYMPNFATDPVDGEKLGRSKLDDPSRCVAKYEYAGGKYENDDDYCPVAWIERLTLTPAAAEARLAARVPKTFTDAASKRVRAQMTDKLRRDAAAMVRVAHANLENVNAAPSDAAQRACRQQATPERLKTAYESCAALAKPGGEDAYVSKVVDELGYSARHAQDMAAVLKQACVQTFCDSSNGTDTAALMGKPPVCMPAPRVDIEPWTHDDASLAYEASPDAGGGGARRRYTAETRTVDDVTLLPSTLVRPLRLLVFALLSVLAGIVLVYGGTLLFRNVVKPALRWRELRDVRLSARELAKK